MSDSDRGAYAPPTEPPLAFDARRPVRGRGPAPMMLIISGLVLLILLAAIAVFYKSGQREGAGPPPVVGTPVGQLKSAPPAAQQPSDPAQGLQIYRQAEGKEKATTPKFTPPPEQPRPRAILSPLSQAASLPARGGVVSSPATPAASPAPVAAQTPTKPVAALPVASPPPALKPTVTATAPAMKPAAAPVVTPAPKLVVVPPQPKPVPAKALPPPVAKPQPVPTPAVKPTAPKVVTPPPPKPAVVAAPATGGGASVQIGAFSSQALADKEWSAAAKLAPGKGKRVEQVPKNGATLFRTTVTGFASRADASAFCDKLKAAGKSCFVK